MSGKTVYKYALYCVTEGLDKYVWSDSTVLPTKCPTDGAHTIGPVVTQVDSVSTDVVEVKESNLTTGGNFMSETIKFTVDPSSTLTIARVWPFPIVALCVKCNSTSVHTGDSFSLTIGRNTIVGAIMSVVAPSSAWASQDYTAGDHVTYAGSQYTCLVNTTASQPPINPATGKTYSPYWAYGYQITVSATVLENMNAGYYVKLDDLTNTDELGRCVLVDADLNSIFVESAPAVNVYSPLTPTYVRMTVYSVKDFELGEPGYRVIGESKIGGSGIPANIIIEGHYTNNSPSVTKTFIGEIEYLY